MKEPLTLLGLGILCVILLSATLYQWQTHKVLKQKQEELDHRLLTQTELEEKEKAIQKDKMLERKRERQEKRKFETAKEVNLNRVQEGGLIIPTENEEDQTSKQSEKNKKDKGKSNLAQLIASPEMKEMMRAQQHLIVEKSYRDFMKQVALTPQEKEKLMELIGKEQMQEFELAQHLLSGQTSEASEKNDSVKDEIKELLGENRYAQYQAYQKTLTERMVVGEFVDQMASSDIPIQVYQKEQLTQILVEEYGQNQLHRISRSSAFGSLLESEKISDDYFDKQREVNERILSRAQTVLNEQQLQRFKQYQENLLTMQEASMKMLKPSN